MKTLKTSTIKIKFYNSETKIYFETTYHPASKKYAIAEASQKATELLSQVPELLGASILGLQVVTLDPTYPRLTAYQL